MYKKCAAMIFLVVAISSSAIEPSGYNLSNATECGSSDNRTKANPALITRFNMLFFMYEHISGHLSPLQSAMSIIYACCGIGIMGYFGQYLSQMKNLSLDQGLI
uniref:Uncharacterized protein n=1 Tax=Acrobeloides nanus TaxID=290746 RepID=A0A914D8T2_9BILA